MAWLGEALPDTGQGGRTPFAPRATSDLIEEALFARRRDLFSTLDLVFFDTTSIYFEGEGGKTLGAHGTSHDHRADLKQMVVGVVVDGAGHSVCCELWPGNTCDVTSAIPVTERLASRFGVAEVCVVADRGMISQDTVDELEAGGWHYILGARLRADKTVREEVLARPGRYHVVGESASPLRVKEVKLGERRYIVCLNEASRMKDAADREAILVSLREKLKQGDKALVGNHGYRKYLARCGPRFEIDVAAVEREARYDGKWVARAPTRDWRPPRWRSSTRSSGRWRRSSVLPSRCLRPARSSIGAMRRFAATSSARSSRWCCARSSRSVWHATATALSGPISCATWRP